MECFGEASGNHCRYQPTDLIAGNGMVSVLLDRHFGNLVLWFGVTTISAVWVWYRKRIKERFGPLQALFVEIVVSLDTFVYRRHPALVALAWSGHEISCRTVFL